jgi:predicted RNA-binding protein with RPS1 domain
VSRKNELIGGLQRIVTQKQQNKLTTSQARQEVKDLAERLKYSVSYARQKYYKTLNRGTEEELPVDEAAKDNANENTNETAIESIDERIEKHAKEKPFFTIPKRYKKGDVVSIEIRRVEPYGAFADVIDDEGKFTGFSGLLHKTEISKNFVNNAEEYFAVGDRVPGVRIIKDEYPTRLSFTTRHLQLEPKYHQLNNDLLNLKESLPSHQIQGEENMNNKATQDDFQQKEMDYLKEEIERIKAYLAKNLGITSPAGEEAVEHLVREHGSFQFTLAMTETMKEFDVYLFLVKQIEQTLKERGGFL